MGSANPHAYRGTLPTKSDPSSHFAPRRKNRLPRMSSELESQMLAPSV